MKQRVISAAVMIAVVLVCVFVSPYTRVLLLAAVAVLSIREMVNVCKILGDRCASWVLYLFSVGSALLTALSISRTVSPVYQAAWLFLAMFLAMFEGIRSSEIRGKGSMATCAVLLYPLSLYAVITMICVAPGWQSVLIIACLATWICDSFALFGGKRFGKNKIAPYVSPNKTVEGCLCGAASSIVAGILSYFIIRAIGSFVPFWPCILISLIASTFGQVGDLAASLLKRSAGIKDYSNLIPGHGGMMDRADSLLFSIPVTWFMLFVFHVL